MNPDLSNYGWGLPIAASSYAHKIDWSLNLLHIVMVAIFVLWGIYMAYCLIRFRQKEGVPADRTPLSPLANYIPDGVILAFDIWLIFVIGIPIWAHLREELPKPENSMIVDVVAEQFSWNFHYPGANGKFGKRSLALMHANNPLGLDENDPDAKDDFFTVNELWVPANKPILLNLSSKDVIHSFFVPEFRVKMDAVPGIKTTLWFEAIRTGTFEIACAQLCGKGHYVMRGKVHVLSQPEFQAWLKQKIKEEER